MEQVIYAFDIGSMYARVAMDTAGNIFGVTNETIFELSPNGKGGWSPTVIYTFPLAGQGYGATFVLGQDGNLFGTTAPHNGTVFELSPGGTGWTEKLLYRFQGGKEGDGSSPSGIVLDAAGNLYGTTGGGGKYNDGTVFELAAPVGKGKYQEKVLWSFNGTDGAGPGGSLIFDNAGNLYGTAGGGGSSGFGVVFEVSGVPATTATTLASSPNPSTYGQAVTFTALITPLPPDGETVTFKKGTTVLGTGLLSGGSASFTTSTLPAGGHTITAIYGGDSNLFGSTSNAVKQVVKKTATTTTLSSSLNPSTYGQAVTFTAVIISSAGAPPDGETVSFKEGTTVLGTGSLSGGSASFTTSALPVGTNSIKAVYGGDSIFAASTSNTVKQVVE
jgi:uncharacterized repeat protein (TIGR03803 family)